MPYKGLKGPFVLDIPPERRDPDTFVSIKKATRDGGWLEICRRSVITVLPCRIRCEDQN